MARKGMTQTARNWAQKTDTGIVVCIDKASKKELKRKRTRALRRSNTATKDVILNIGNRKVLIKSANSPEQACTNCCFATHGRSNRTCPQVKFMENEGNQHLSNMHLCTIVGTGKTEYFINLETKIYA